MKKLLTIVSLCLVVMMVLPLMTSAAFAYDHDPETGALVADDKILIGLDCSNPDVAAMELYPVYAENYEELTKNQTYGRRTIGPAAEFAELIGIPFSFTLAEMLNPGINSTKTSEGKYVPDGQRNDCFCITVKNISVHEAIKSLENNPYIQYAEYDFIYETDTPSVKTNGLPFTDVKDGKWYTDAVKYVYENKLMNGMTDTTFEPDTPMNRAMLVTVLYRAEGEPVATGATPFTDLKAGWYKKSVAWAYENKVVNGTSDTTFSPLTPITREQIATIFYRFAQFKGRDVSAKANLNTFPDGSKVSKFAKDAMTWAVGEGLITGTKVGGKTILDPKGNATRAQVATILMRYLESGAPLSLEDKVENFLDFYLCGAHTKLDLFFNYTDSSLTEENMAALLKDLIGLDDAVTVEFDDFDELTEGYQGSGDGSGSPQNGWVWVDGINVTFTDPATEETYTAEIDFSLRKVIPLSGLDEYKNGVLGICPEDANEDMKDAYRALNSVSAFDGDTYDGYTGDYSLNEIEAFFRELTGLTDKDAYEFIAVGFDPLAPGQPFFPMFRDKKNEEGRLDVIWIETAFDVPLENRIDNVLDYYYCVTHGKLDVMFGSAGDFTEENLIQFFAGLFGLEDGYTITVDHDQFAEIKDAFSGAGTGTSVWMSIDTTFTDTATGENVTEAIDLNLVKDWFAKNSGAVEAYALYFCWDDVPDDAKAALETVEDYDDETVVTIPADGYSVAAVEAKFREITGLSDAGRWEFFINGFEEEKKDEGDYVVIGFKLVEEGRTYVVGCEALLKAE